MEHTFINDQKIFDLIETYGSPLYVYDETILRARCRELRRLLPGKNLRVTYSAKANSNLELLKIVRSEGFGVDAMSPGEIYLQQAAGFLPEQIFYIGNNVSADEMKYAIGQHVLMSVDSLSQLDLYGRIHPNSDVAVRFNAGVGAGHHAKVITSGAHTKFGIQQDFIPEVKQVLQKYHLNLVGINQHIGSLFLEGSAYIDSVRNLLKIAQQFPGLKFVDMGGGFGIPYREGEGRLDLGLLSEQLDAVLTPFVAAYDNKDIVFKMEPGRYVVAECGILLGQVYSIKENYSTKYVGTDLGFNALMRPILYDSYHGLHVAKKGMGHSGKTETYTVVGNICETGDVIARDRELPKIAEGDILVVKNAGAYGYSMSSNYNCRLRPAEVLVTANGENKLIRRRDTLEDLTRNF